MSRLHGKKSVAKQQAKGREFSSEQENFFSQEDFFPCIHTAFDFRRRRRCRYCLLISLDTHTQNTSNTVARATKDFSKHANWVARACNCFALYVYTYSKFRRFGVGVPVGRFEICTVFTQHRKHVCLSGNSLCWSNWNKLLTSTTTSSNRLIFWSMTNSQNLFGVVDVTQFIHGGALVQLSLKQ